ncbi:hypothetical protein J437_LFUL003529 [Ladona fulva]|uniref:Uncharacterized protein n=1 Tax=Ladona fulva TaxID=123851 RepID=A0A8K0JVA2_LADFU|nr:hypothetical protein J437_LFUL003529 [Ladona fulva]
MREEVGELERKPPPLQVTKEGKCLHTYCRKADEASRHLVQASLLESLQKLARECAWGNLTSHPEYLLNEINAVLEVHSEIYESPRDPLYLVFLLFQHEHVVVEKLLELFVGEIDAELIKAVDLMRGNRRFCSKAQRLRIEKGFGEV